jgi:hypothetical protein
VEQDQTSEYLKASTYAKGIESLKSSVNDIMVKKEQEDNPYTEQKFNTNKELSQRGIVILHVHGGGFVAMSSCSHQNYTRIWAN